MPSRHDTVRDGPVAVQPNFAVVLREAAGGWVAILTETAVLVAGISTRAAAGATANRHARAAIGRDRRTARMVVGRTNWWGSST